MRCPVPGRGSYLYFERFITGSYSDYFTRTPPVLTPLSSLWPVTEDMVMWSSSLPKTTTDTHTQNVLPSQLSRVLSSVSAASLSCWIQPSPGTTLLTGLERLSTSGRKLIMTSGTSLWL